MSNITVFNSAKAPAFARNAVLSETTLALAGGAASGPGVKRVSIKGGVFRLVAGGKEIANIEDRHLDVIVVKAAPKVSRIFYMGKYDKDAAAVAPDCWSNDGDMPDKSIKSPQASNCAKCQQNIAGSGNGNSRACRYQQRLAVVLANNPSGDVLQVTLPATSIFGKGEGDKLPLQAFARWAATQTPPVNLDAVVTRMKFDTTAESPKLVFSPQRWLTDEEYETVQEKAQSVEAQRAVMMTPAGADGVTKPAPMMLDGKRPDVAEEEDEAPKPKKKAAPAVSEDDEPEVRKAAPKSETVPAKKGKLADIVADWDDE
ncbi:hypothetical protein K0U83_19065 [bacterium]|jgi:hypothetical protein|nr:hypothetical protein [bacterium]